jgi:hypothetical protein
MRLGVENETQHVLVVVIGSPHPQFLQGKLSANGLQDRFASAFSMVKHADAVEWCRQRLGEHSVDEI